MSFLVNPYVYAAPLDPDCAAFLTATGITNPTISGAVCTLVTSLKSANLWTKLNAIYPMVGGTATTCKFNLKNPADTNAAFRLNFVGGWVFSSNGALPNGVNTYADTFLNPATTLTLNSSHISYYSRTNINQAAAEIGAFEGLSTSQINIRYLNTTYYRINAVSTNWVTFADTDSSAFYLSNRTASNILNGWRNSVKVATGSAVSTFLSSFNYYLGAINNTGSASFFSSKQCAFATIGSGLTDGEAATLYTIIQTFQTTLGRQV